ncbi:MAG: extracellular solute-binding protein [Hyphomicrobiaceae bacterium]
MIYRFIAAFVLSILTIANSKVDPAFAQTESDLTVATFGGAYGQALDIAVLKPFADETNIRVKPKYHPKNEDSLDALNATAPQPDVVELDRHAIDTACANGLLTKWQSSGAEDNNRDTGDTDRTRQSNRDTLDGFLHDCGVASLSWASITVFNTKAFKKKPRQLRDLFKTKSFPGKRALVAKPEFLFETILMADGVRAGKVYETLETDAGLKRVLRRLSKLEPHIIWANTQTESLDLVEKGQAVLGQAFNGRVFIDSARGAPISIVWDGQIYDTNYYAIPKDAPNQQGAEKFVAFATKTAQLAGHAELIAYGPRKRSAIAELSLHPTLGIELAPYLPTHPRNVKRALARDAAWWDLNRPRLAHAFANWMSGTEARAEKRAQDAIARKAKKKRRYKKRRKKRRRR